MKLNAYLKNIFYDVNALSIGSSKKNKLNFDLYKDLYKYRYFNEHHMLIKSNNGEVKQEFSLRINDECINDKNIYGYSLSYAISRGNVIIKILMKNNTNSPYIYSFYYNLENKKMLYELNVFLQQNKVELYFLKLLGDMLEIENSMQILLPDKVKAEINKKIQEFFIRKNKLANLQESEKKIITLEELIPIEDIKKKEDAFQKYNWVDVKDIAKNIFWNYYKSEMAWAEDAWNIIFFNNVIRSENIIKSKKSDYEKGDILLWLVAMYDIYIKYKISIDYEPNWEDADFVEYISHEDNAEKYISMYLKNEIYEELNEQLINGSTIDCEFYNTNTNVFNLCRDSISFEVYSRKVEKRAAIIKKKIYQYFDDKIYEIVFFMKGTHWAENYFDYSIKENKIIDKYEKIEKAIEEGYKVKCYVGNSEYTYVNADEVNEDREEELEDLEREYNSYITDGENLRVYDFINNGMDF